MQLNMNSEHPYGVLLNENDIKLQRQWFEEMSRLIGINVIYRAPKPDKHWTTYSEIESNYYPAQLVSCVFNETPEQKTMKKLGWVAELNESASIISVPYDLENLQVGALFIVPSAVNPKQGRLFRVSKMSTVMMYPATVTCELVPEYTDTDSMEQIRERREHASLLKLNREEEWDR